MAPPVRRGTPIAVALALLAAPSGAEAARQVPPGFVGATWSGPMLDESFDAAAETELMRRSGIESARVPFYWRAAQPYATAGDVPDHLAPRFRDADGVPTDFGQSDRLVALAAARGIAVLPVVLESPRWAARDAALPWSPPADPRDYARFAGALVERYGPGGSFWRERPDLPAKPIRSWQIWNEPGQRYFWAPRPSPAAYVALLRAARAAILAADPGATIVLGGLNEYAWKAIARIYEAGGRGLFDVAAVHPFTLEVDNVLRIVGLVRRAMARAGDARVPLLVTEMSWPTGTRRIFGFEVSERVQAIKAADALERLAAARNRYGIRGVVWETWISAHRDPDSPFDWAGLRAMGPDGPRSKPALGAFGRVARRLAGMRAQQ
jgi:hypothetical protein